MLHKVTNLVTKMSQKCDIGTTGLCIHFSQFKDDSHTEMDDVKPSKLHIICILIMTGKSVSVLLLVNVKLHFVKENISNIMLILRSKQDVRVQMIFFCHLYFLF